MTVTSRNIFDKNYIKLAFETILKMKQNGDTYEEIAKSLTKEGWTGVNGTKLSQPVVSRFMVENGFRVHTEANRNKKGGKGRPRKKMNLREVTMPVVNASDDLPPPKVAKLNGQWKAIEQDIVTILNTTFSSPEVKKHIIGSLVDLQ